MSLSQKINTVLKSWKPCSVGDQMSKRPLENLSVGEFWFFKLDILSDELYRLPQGAFVLVCVRQQGTCDWQQNQPDMKHNKSQYFNSHAPEKKPCVIVNKICMNFAGPLSHPCPIRMLYTSKTTSLSQFKKWISWKAKWRKIKPQIGNWGTEVDVSYFDSYFSRLSSPINHRLSDNLKKVK